MNGKELHEHFVIKVCRWGGTRDNILALKDQKVLSLMDCLAHVCLMQSWCVAAPESDDFTYSMSAISLFTSLCKRVR
jgi:hypothetical protein